MKFLITGASSGLGAELASQLLHFGDVIGISRRVGSDQKLKIDNYQHIAFDLGELKHDYQCKNLENKLENMVEENPLTLVINAAIFYSGNERLDKAKTDELFEVNLFSVIALIKVSKKFNLRRIVIVNSISGLIGQSLQHEYAASKHALMGYTRSLIKEAKNLNYDVLCFNPGGIKTPLWDTYPEIDTSQFLDPVELSKIMLSLITSKQRMFIEEMRILPGCDI